MIKIVQGDLLQATENIICHQVNCQGVMNSGVAKSIREAFPEAYESYIKMVNHYRNSGLKQKDLLGRINGAVVGENKWVANMFGQLTYGYDGKQYTNTTALFNCFKDIRGIAERNELSVAMPYMIGCYRGGADWKEVEELLLIAFKGYEVTLYKLHKG